MSHEEKDLELLRPFLDRLNSLRQELELRETGIKNISSHNSKLRQQLSICNTEHDLCVSERLLHERQLASHHLTECQRRWREELREARNLAEKAEADVKQQKYNENVFCERTKQACLQVSQLQQQVNDLERSKTEGGHALAENRINCLSGDKSKMAASASGLPHFNVVSKGLQPTAKVLQSVIMEALTTANEHRSAPKEPQLATMPDCLHLSHSCINKENSGCVIPHHHHPLHVSMAIKSTPNHQSTLQCESMAPRSPSPPPSSPSKDDITQPSPEDLQFLIIPINRKHITSLAAANLAQGGSPGVGIRASSSPPGPQPTLAQVQLSILEDVKRNVFSVEDGDGNVDNRLETARRRVRVPFGRHPCSSDSSNKSSDVMIVDEMLPTQLVMACKGDAGSDIERKMKENASKIFTEGEGSIPCTIALLDVGSVRSNSLGLASEPQGINFPSLSACAKDHMEDLNPTISCQPAFVLKKHDAMPSRAGSLLQPTPLGMSGPARAHASGKVDHTGASILKEVETAMAESACIDLVDKPPAPFVTTESLITPVTSVAAATKALAAPVLVTSVAAATKALAAPVPVTSVAPSTKALAVVKNTSALLMDLEEGSCDNFHHEQHRDRTRASNDKQQITSPVSTFDLDKREHKRRKVGISGDDQQRCEQWNQKHHDVLDPLKQQSQQPHQQKEFGTIRGRIKQNPQVQYQQILVCGQFKNISEQTEGSEEALGGATGVAVSNTVSASLPGSVLVAANNLERVGSQPKKPQLEPDFKSERCLHKKVSPPLNFSPPKSTYLKSKRSNYTTTITKTEAMAVTGAERESAILEYKATISAAATVRVAGEIMLAETVSFARVISAALPEDGLEITTVSGGPMTALGGGLRAALAARAGSVPARIVPSNMIRHTSEVGNQAPLSSSSEPPKLTTRAMKIQGKNVRPSPETCKYSTYLPQEQHDFPNAFEKPILRPIQQNESIKPLTVSSKPVSNQNQQGQPHEHCTVAKGLILKEFKAEGPKFAPEVAAPRSSSTPGTGYKYVEVVRKKDEREALPGVGCPQCVLFYDAIRSWGPEMTKLPTCGHVENSKNTLVAGSKTSATDLSKTALWQSNLHASKQSSANQQQQQPGLGQQQQQQLVQDVSRHRYRFACPSTPAGFWDMGFMDSLDSRCDVDSPTALSPTATSQDIKKNGHQLAL